MISIPREGGTGSSQGARCEARWTQAGLKRARWPWRPLRPQPTTTQLTCCRSFVKSGDCRCAQCVRDTNGAGRTVVRDHGAQCTRSGVNHHVRYTREMRYSVRSTSNFPKATTKSAKTQYDKIQFMEWS